MIDIATNALKPAAGVTWERFRKYCQHYPTIGLTLDISRMPFDESFLEEMQPRLQRAFAEMQALEQGAIANPDEKRMVGHYWLRTPELSPTPEIRQAIEENLRDVKRFAADVHSGVIRGAGGQFKNVLLIGIGGSALGPQFVAHALGHPKTDKMSMHFFDNTDPDGIDRVLASIGTSSLGQTLSIVISKSGGTKETANGMKEARAAYARAALRFEEHAVAITMADSHLDKQSISEQWLRRFPMWDWVGGRTSQLSAVGLLPAALQGINIDTFIGGARACDALTRQSEGLRNPAAQLALMWFAAGGGKGSKDMVIVPYKDRLELLSRYLQQLIMESVGKATDRDGKTVNQGISVFGNKGATDQHSYIQQLRDGIDNYFITFIEARKDRTGASMFVDDSVSSGDYLHSFLTGTRNAITEAHRGVLTIAVDEVSGFSVGVLVALFERCVGLYASLININAYHQPGVEAGKRGATDAIGLRSKVLCALREQRGMYLSVEHIASDLEVVYGLDSIQWICDCLADNACSGIQRLINRRNDVLFRAV